MTVITISRQIGSGGDEIAASICKLTGYKLFDKHLLAVAAFESGLADQEIVDYCEDNFKVKNFFERLFNPSRPVAQARIWKEGTDGVRQVEELPLDEEHALRCVQEAVMKAYGLGRFVIVGRGGQALLKDKADVLHVRVIAPNEDRLLRVRHSPAMSGRVYSDAAEERRAAQVLLEKQDAASAHYLKRFYNVDWADPGLYHVLINTGRMPIEAAARMIIEAARALQPVAA
jgi:cytidylate kinase